MANKAQYSKTLVKKINIQYYLSCTSHNHINKYL